VPNRSSRLGYTWDVHFERANTRLCHCPTAYFHFIFGGSELSRSQAGLSSFAQTHTTGRYVNSSIYEQPLVLPHSMHR
jgi:hypothetical protein